MSNPFDFRAAAKQVLDIEVSALQELDKYFDEQFE
ncbi:D-arabinose 5-phosphate isomerase, partial [Vibrio sp. 1565-1]|nr:D-arabinose 5-phosphate isomerase [Vibrio sp. 1565-1]